VFLEQQRENHSNITTRVAKEFSVQMMQTNIRNMVTIDSLQQIIELQPKVQKNKIMKNY